MLFDILAGIGEIILGVATTLTEAIVDVFNQDDKGNNKTYEYWSKLSYSEQEYYFNNNEYLKGYIKNDYYPNDRHLTAKHVQYIADKLNRDFTNISEKY